MNEVRMKLYVGIFDDYVGETKNFYLIKASSKREAEQKLRKREGLKRLNSEQALEVRPLVWTSDIIAL